MAKLSVCLLLCVVSSGFGLYGSKDKHFINDGSGQRKLSRLEEGLQKTADLIKNLNVTTPFCKVKLEDMANDLMFTDQSALYEVNQAIPYIKDEHLHDDLIKIVNGFSEIAHDIQLHLHEKPDILKSCLAGILENAVKLIRKLAKLLHTDEYKNEIFIANQLRRAINEGIYGVVKLKFEAEFFKKSNKELETVIDSKQEAFCKSLQNVKGDDAKITEGLLYLIEFIETVEDFGIFELENFLHVNGGDDKNILIVKEVSIKLSESCDAFHLLGSGHYEVANLKTEFEILYRDATNTIKKLLQVDVSENTLGGLFIRSILFDSISLSSVFERELSNEDIKLLV